MKYYVIATTIIHWSLLCVGVIDSYGHMGREDKIISYVLSVLVGWGAVTWYML